MIEGRGALRWRWRSGRGPWAVLALLLLCWSAAAAAQTPADPEELPAIISAAEIAHDQELGIITASGDVEIIQGDRVLKADQVSYNTRNDVVTASGNVSLTEPGGDVVFAEYVELTGDLREGFVRDIRVLLRDDTRLAALGAVRTRGRRTVFRKGVFSPCKLCIEDRDRAPLWQIKAEETEHDEEEQVVRYRHARMEIFGVPIAYTPYFEHPDWTVERKSGLLMPSIGRSGFLGEYVQVPYFWAIGPDRDLTVTPMLSRQQGLQLSSEYRQLFSAGYFEGTASGTVADRRDHNERLRRSVFRGHLDASGLFGIDRHWRWGFDVLRATDDTYLRSFNIDSSALLISRLFSEGFHGANYARAELASYQSTRAEQSNRQQPIVAPLVFGSYVSEPLWHGGHLTAEGGLLSLWRRDGRDVQRASVTLGWEQPFNGPVGDRYRFRLAVNTDLYSVKGYDPDDPSVVPADPKGRRQAGRIYPQAALEWRYPWISQQAGLRQVIEPVAQIVVTPNRVAERRIPNEDSIDAEFDDTNIFKLNRFPGRDRVETGTRVDYGLQYSVDTGGGFYSEAFLGQSYRLYGGSSFEEGSGLHRRLSDYVGRVYARPADWIDGTYRFRLDSESYAARRHELDVRVGVPEFQVEARYLDFKDPTETQEFGRRQELTLQISSQVTENWHVRARVIRDIDERRNLRAGFTIGYEDECFLIETTAERRRFRDRELRPDYAFFMRVGFKYLGGMATR